MFTITLTTQAFLAGMFVERNEHLRQLAEAKAAFIEDVRLANEAYANQKVIDDKQLAGLKQQVETTPPDPTIALKKDTAKRIGAIR